MMKLTIERAQEKINAEYLIKLRDDLTASAIKMGDNEPMQAKLIMTAFMAEDILQSFYKPVFESSNPRKKYKLTMTPRNQ